MSAVGRTLLLARTLPRLGLQNVVAVAAHKAGERFGLYNRRAPLALPEGPFFTAAAAPAPPDIAPGEALLARARAIVRGELQIFGDRTISLGAPFEWSRNVLPVLPRPDIKGVWEASRFGWAADLARAHRLSPQEGFRDCLESFTADWLAQHPPFVGANWSCGQEASIRLLHLLLAARILAEAPEVTPGLAAICALHLERIDRTLAYAIAQDNNHATSEAAALFIGGSVVARFGEAGMRGKGRRWRERGRSVLERLLSRLVLPDGGFSQYSVNYHRVLVDTLSQVELWRRELAEPEFGKAYRRACASAVHWLGAVTNPASGRVPNIGHNDGAQVYRLGEGSFGDYRASLTLACVLLLGKRPPLESFDPEPLAWLGLDPPAGTAAELLDKRSTLFPDWGLALLNPRENGSGAYAFVRYPVRRFRPAQADMLHFDLWSGCGRNLLIDSGSFSYAHPDGLAQFAGIAAHNTIAFDRGEPMRRIGRFLFADWPQADETGSLQASGDRVQWSAAYRDHRGNRHRRTVDAQSAQWTIEDEIGGFSECAEIFWHLPLQEYRLDGGRLETEDMSLTLDAGRGLAVRIEETFVSPTYGRRDRALVLIGEVPAGTDRIFSRIELRG